MPYDPVPAERIATKAEWEAATPIQRRIMLIYALEHMPSTHHWSFNYFSKDAMLATRRLGTACKSAGCACGLAEALFGCSSVSSNVGRLVGLDMHSLTRIFFPHSSKKKEYQCDLSKVTPQMVADKLRETLPT